jgi:capsid assembly protease
MIHPRIAAKMFNTRLAVHKGKAAAIMAGLGGRVIGGRIQFSDSVEVLNHSAFHNSNLMAGTLTDRIGKTSVAIYETVRGAAYIPVEGTLVHKGSWVESDSGETSYQGLQSQIQRARRDPSVKGAVFEFDTCGGEVSGMFETADMLADLSAEKPTIAILSDCAYSAGYLLASACRSIIVPEQGGAGSIGVITMHADMSKALEAQGVNVTIFAAGEHKADMNPFGPVPEDVALALLADIESARVAFCQAVSTFRGPRLSFENAMATEAQCYTGAAAVEAGLVDATGHPYEAFNAFLDQLNRA